MKGQRARWGHHLLCFNYLSKPSRQPQNYAQQSLHSAVALLSLTHSLTKCQLIYVTLENSNRCSHLSWYLILSRGRIANDRSWKTPTVLMTMVEDLVCCCLWPATLISASPPSWEIVEKTINTCRNFYVYFIPKESTRYFGGFLSSFTSLPLLPLIPE